MAKSYDEKIAEAKKKIEQEQNHIKQLIQRQKDQARKDRTKRLIERGAILGSLNPELASLTNEQV